MERFFDYFAPAHYDLDLRINDEKTRISGTAVITGEAKAETIKLHAVRMEIKSVQLDGAKFEGFTHEDGVLTLKNIPVATHEIKVKFVSRIEADMEGAYLSTYEHEGETEKMVVTQFESHYARECFPCVDEPIAKATFSLKLTSLEEDTLLSNMPATFTTAQEGHKTVEFAESPRMSTYMLGLIRPQRTSNIPPSLPPMFSTSTMIALRRRSHYQRWTSSLCQILKPARWKTGA